MNKYEETILREFHPDLVRSGLITEKLDEILKDHPIDSLDLNPHLQIHNVVDQIIKYMIDEKQFRVTSEEILTIWLLSNILGFRNDKAINFI